MEDYQLGIVQLIVFHLAAGNGDGSFGHLLPNQHDTYFVALALVMDFLVQHLRILKGELLVDKTVGSTLKEGILDDTYRQIDSGTHGQDSNQDDIFTYFLLPVLIHKLLALEVHHAHAQESGKTDKHGINEIKIECTEEINQVTRCQPVACRTERRHQSRSNGNTRNHISFLFGRERRHTCQATHQGDEYVINGG